jgi:hypothetical protein
VRFGWCKGANEELEGSSRGEEASDHAERRDASPHPTLRVCLFDQVATVTSAVKLENEQQFLIAKKLQEMTGAKNIKLKPQVDESLIGGFVVAYGPGGSNFVDMSVKGQLDKISASMVAA